VHAHTNTHTHPSRARARARACVCVCVCNILVNSMEFDDLQEARCDSLKLPTSMTFPTTLL